MRIVTTYEDGEADLIEVVSAQYVGNFAIRTTFSDGASHVVHFRHFLERSQHPAIRKYLNENLFSLFNIVDGNLNWNNYELIFPLEDLYENKI
jgi:hypothetical protein